ncbi:olfactory receptor 1030-like [Dermochelys coriacea]|uniref:olfactory receptor 1030-like n=1 Tax=Dermochelys coriacea TaxID=27794 RepID=UPI001CA87D0E|nr:olfactory receptor 1030-like [Dermochelys coriacea]
MENQITMTEFILMELASDPQLQIFLFLVFLVIYLITLLGNMLIMLVIRADPHLHTPMCFFLSNLSFVDICYSSITVPKMLVNFLAEQKTISIDSCLIQMFFFLASGTTEIFMLSAMAYDRYEAICHPLNYIQNMSKWVCIQLARGAWAIKFTLALVNTLVLRVHFCKFNKINHFCCEIPPVLHISCSDTLANEAISSVIVGLGSSSVIIVSYSLIISTILRIRSTERWHKAFSTCGSHLTVVLLFCVKAFFKYLRPASGSSFEKIVTVQYSILTPMLNPIIYILKNRGKDRPVQSLRERPMFSKHNGAKIIV